MTWDPSLLSQPEASSVEPHIDIHYDGGLAALDLTKFGAFTDELAARGAGDAALATALAAAIAAFGHGLKSPGFLTASSIPIGTALTDVVSFSWTSNGGAIIVAGFANVVEIKSVNAPFIHSFRLARNGGGIGISATQRAQAPNDNLALGLGTLLTVDQPAAGTYTYSMQASYANASTSGTPTASGVLMVLELSP